ncbi:MAG: DUF4124 domain-containing protein [Pseudomonadota bacterium]
MLRIVLISLLAAACAGANGQALYKCTVKGKVTYTGAPCTAGAAKAIAVDAAPVPDPDRAEKLKREKTALATLQKAREKREEKAQREEIAAMRGAGAHERRCAKLQLENKLAQEDADRAAGFDKEALKLKAQRKGEAFAVECGS